MTIEEQLERIADNIEELKDHFLNPPLTIPSSPIYGNGIEALPRILEENKVEKKPKKKKKKKSKAEQIYEAEAKEEPKSSPKITKDTMMDALRELMAVKDSSAVKSILGEFGAKNTAEVKMDDYEACFNRACQQLGKPVNG